MQQRQFVPLQTAWTESNRYLQLMSKLVCTGLGLLATTLTHAAAQELRCSLNPSLLIENAAQFSEDDKDSAKRHVLVEELKQNAKLHLSLSLEAGSLEILPPPELTSATFETGLWELSKNQSILESEPAEATNSEARWIFDRRGSSGHKEFVRISQNPATYAPAIKTYGLEIKSQKPDFVGTISTMSTTNYICMDDRDFAVQRSFLPERIDCSSSGITERLGMRASEGLYLCSINDNTR